MSTQLTFAIIKPDAVRARVAGRILARNPNVSPQAIQQTRERWGIDKPLIPDQLVAYIAATFQGDLGNSFGQRGRPVTEVVGSRLGPTLLLFGLGEVIAIVIGLALGAYAGWRRGGAIDLVGNGISLVLYSMPYFLLGMILLLVFASTLHWFPSFGMTTLGVAHDFGADEGFLVAIAALDAFEDALFDFFARESRQAFDADADAVLLPIF